MTTFELDLIINAEIPLAKDNPSYNLFIVRKDICKELLSENLTEEVRQKLYDSISDLNTILRRYVLFDLT